MQGSAEAKRVIDFNSQFALSSILLQHPKESVLWHIVHPIWIDTMSHHSAAASATTNNVGMGVHLDACAIGIASAAIEGGLAQCAKSFYELAGVDVHYLKKQQL